MKALAHVIALLDIEQVENEEERFPSIRSTSFCGAGPGAPVFALRPSGPQEISNGGRPGVFAHSVGNLGKALLVRSKSVGRLIGHGCHVTPPHHFSISSTNFSSPL
jgi:hypothetical protein